MSLNDAMNLNGLFGSIGSLGANLYGSQQQMNQQWAMQQQQMNQYQALMGQALGMMPHMPVPTAPLPARCSYCGKRPKLSIDDRCDGCGAPR